jgi:hypothetical protein
MISSVSANFTIGRVWRAPVTHSDDNFKEPEELVFEVLVEEVELGEVLT